MLNLIRMNNYRVRHMTCMYVLIVIASIFAFFSVSTIDMTAEGIESGEYEDYETAVDAFEAGWNEAEAEALVEANGGSVEEVNEAYEASEEEEEIELQFGIISSLPVLPDGTITSYLAYLYEDATSGILLIFITIGAVLFFNREQNSGFIKNISSRSVPRSNIYFSKLISMIMYIVFTFVIFAVAEYIFLMIHYKGDMTFGMDIMGDFLARMGIVLLLHIAFVSGVVMLTTITRSSTLGITIGMLASTGFSALITMPIKALLGLDLNKYLVQYNIASVDLNSKGGLLIDALLVGIIAIVVYNGIACTYFAKKDIA